MSGEGGGSSSGIDSNLISIHYPVSCVNCYLNYGDFCAVYSQQIEKLVGLAQNHGLIYAGGRHTISSNSVALRYVHINDHENTFPFFV